MTVARLGLWWLVACAGRTPTPVVPAQVPSTADAPSPPAPEPVMPTLPIDADVLEGLKAASGPFELPLRFDDPLQVGRAVLAHGTVQHALVVDSTALSMTLDMHLAPHCRTYPCRVWVDASWGPLIGETVEPTVTVRRVLGPVEGEPDHVKLR